MRPTNVILFLLIHLTNGNNVEKWWKNNYFYNVNIKSYMDSDGDGIGDINGFVRKLDHLISLKVDSIILSPIFKAVRNCSQHGVESFYEIDDQIGDLEQFRSLIKVCKKLGKKVLLDLNIEETSVKSNWFLSQNEDFYIKSGEPQTTEENTAGENSKWMWDDNKMEYYKANGYTGIEYPALNFKEKKLYEELQNVLKHWMDIGVAGFKINLGKVQIFEDGKVGDGFEFLKNFMDNYSRKNGGMKRILIGHFEQDAKDVLGNNRISIEECFHALFMDSFIYGLEEKHTAKDIKFIIDKTMTYSADSDSEQPNWILGTHDKSRLYSRVGHQNAEGIAMVAFLLPGSIMINQGDEIGMSDADNITPDDDVDVCKQYLESVHTRAKLSANTPYQWDDSPNSGFSNSTQTWLNLANDYKVVNTKKQKLNERSTFNIYKNLAELRKMPIFQNSNFESYSAAGVILLVKRQEFESLVVLFNPSSKTRPVQFDVFEGLSDELTVILSNEVSNWDLGEKTILDKLRLSSGEALVGIIASKPCDSAKPVDKIVSKLSDAVKKVNDYFKIRDVFSV